MTYKTLCIQYKPTQKELQLFRFLSHECKHIYNKTLFCFLFLYSYKNRIFKDLYDHTKDLLKNKKKDSIDPVKDEILTNIRSKMHLLINTYYDYYISIKDQLHINNQLIYQYVTDYISTNNIIINNKNYSEYLSRFNKELDKIIKTTEKNKFDLLDNILTRILKSIYNKNYFSVQYSIKNHQPLKIKDAILITDVKNENYLFKDPDFSWKNKIETDFKKYKLDNDIGTLTLAYKTIILHLVIPKLSTKIAYDIRARTIDKAIQAIDSFFALKQAGKKCNFPKYLPYESHYNVCFSTRSLKKIKVNSKYYTRLTLGDYISDNYPDIINDKKLICLNKNDNTRYKQYIDPVHTRNLEKRSNEFKKTGYSINDQYISSTNKNIIDSYYFNIPLPKRIQNKELAIVELIPEYDGTFFRFHYVYIDDNIEEVKVEPVKNIPDKKNINNTKVIVEKDDTSFSINYVCTDDNTIEDVKEDSAKNTLKSNFVENGIKLNINWDTTKRNNGNTE